MASAISDRICIHSNGTLQPEISARNIIACDRTSFGCHGGFTYNAWIYWRNVGVVTGGSYGSKIVSFSTNKLVNAGFLVDKLILWDTWENDLIVSYFKYQPFQHSIS